jgi:hypothetical protein
MTGGERIDFFRTVFSHEGALPGRHAVNAYADDLPEREIKAEMLRFEKYWDKTTR